MSYQTDVDHDKGCPREFNAEPRGRHDECTCDEDRSRDLLKELLAVAREQNPKAASFELRYIIDGIDIDLSMRPLHGYTIGNNRGQRLGVSSDR